MNRSLWAPVSPPPWLTSPGRREWSISLNGEMGSFSSPAYFLQEMFPDNRDLVGGGYRKEGSEGCHL